MPAQTEPSNPLQLKLPQLRSKSELTRFLGRTVHFKGVITVGLSERVRTHSRRVSNPDVDACYTNQGSVVLVKTADCKLLRVLLYDVRLVLVLRSQMALIVSRKVVPEIGTSVDVIGVIHTLEEMQAWKFYI